MGKALLIIVMGAGFILARQGLGNQITERETREDQIEYEEEVLAREISRSAFNVAMGIAREFPNALDAAVLSVDMADNSADGIYSGTARGGQFAVRTETTSGHALRVTSTGYYGGTWEDGSYVDGASYTMSDTYSIKVLEVREDGELNVEFLASVAGYCSSVFMEEWREDEKLATRMIFPSGHNRDGETPASSFYVEAGTQLNFFIGVDQNCDSEVSLADECEVRTHMMSYPLSNIGTEWDYVHNALEFPEGSISEAKESVWGLVEQLPTDRQSWRVAWEDVHDVSWNNPTSTDPRSSIQAFKIQGYDVDGDGVGDGWQERDDFGYRALTEGGLDLNDQQIQISLRPTQTQAKTDELWYEMKAERDKCGITTTEGMPPEPDEMVCHNGNEMLVKATNLTAHLNHGDTKGACPAGQVQVCHAGSQIEVPVDKRQEHIDHGDTPGTCPEQQYEVCHYGVETNISQSQLQLHLNHGDTQGACPSEPEIDEDCPCNQKQLQDHKVGVFHRTTKQKKGRTICIAKSAWNSAHKPLTNHHDHLLCGTD